MSYPKVYSIDFAPNYWICTPSVPSQGIFHWFCPKLLNLNPNAPSQGIPHWFCPKLLNVYPQCPISGWSRLCPSFLHLNPSVPSQDKVDCAPVSCIWTPVSYPKVCTSPNSLHLLHNVRSQGVVSCAPSYCICTAADCSVHNFGSVNCTNKMWVSLLFYIPIWVS